jgi:hypothetical protein
VLTASHTIWSDYSVKQSAMRMCVVAVFHNQIKIMPSKLQTLQLPLITAVGKFCRRFRMNRFNSESVFILALVQVALSERQIPGTAFSGTQ